MNKDVDMDVNLSQNEIKAIRTALYHQWHRVTDDNGKAISCTQEIADATYEALGIFEALEKDLDANEEEREM